MRTGFRSFFASLANSQKQVGLWVSLSNNYVAEVLAHAGYDWVLIDMEHSPNNLQTVLGQLQAFAQGDSLALVRPPSNDPVVVKQLLDLGVQGLLFPMIQTVQEAEQAVASTRYPPEGIRGVAGSTRATRFGRIKNYPHSDDARVPLVMQIETRAALENAEEIASVEGVDAIFFGPADIAADIGIVGKPLNKRVWDLIMPVASKLIAQGVPVGTLVLDSEFATNLLNQGFQFVACGADSALLANSADQLLANVKGGLV